MPKIAARRSTRRVRRACKRHVRRPARLRLLVCSDLRVQSLPELIAWIRQLEPRPDLIVYAGDDVDRFVEDDDTNHWATLATLARFGVVAVMGNDDDPTRVPPIGGHRRVTDLGLNSRRIGDFAFHGVEGAEATPTNPAIGYLCRSPRQIRETLRRALQAAPHCVGTSGTSEAPNDGETVHAVRRRQELRRCKINTGR